MMGSSVSETPPAPSEPAAAPPDSADEAPPAESKPARSTFRLRDGLQILGIALLLALFMRTCVLEGFRIPTESMEQSLLVGDFVLVSKLHYGPRLPMTVGVPLTNWYVGGVELPYARLPGFTSIRRGDAVVFNYPRDRAPLDRRLHYIKRVVGLPGDSVALRDKHLYVNDTLVPLGETMQHRWIAETAPDYLFPLDSLRALGASQVAVLEREQGKVAFVAPRAVTEVVASWDGVTRVEPYVQAQNASFGVRIFPRGSGFGRDHYGPLYVPARGDTILLTKSNWLYYQDLIEHYEHHQARLLPLGDFEIDGARTTHYVIEQDYYFVLGDNRDSSVDSRIWGFVPMDHVVGKAVFVYFSWEAEQRRLRSERLFKGID